MTDIKYFASHYVSFKDNITENNKVILVKWIMEASDAEIKSLLIRGDYIFHQESVEEFDKIIWFLNENFAIGVGDSKFWAGIVDVQKLKSAIEKAAEIAKEKGYAGGKEAGREIGREAGMVQGLATAAVAALVITVSYKAYKRFLSKASRACRGKKFAEKTSCMNKYKRDAMKKRLMDLNTGMSSCSKTKNPSKCKAKIINKARKLKAKLGTL
jgi:hypothetical protein